MVEVFGSCQLAASQDNQSYWPVVFVVMFSCFLSVDVGLTAYSLWNAVRVGHAKG